MQSAEQMPMNYFFDVRESVARIRLENTHLDEDELFDLRRSLETIGIIVNFLNKNNGDDENPEYPTLLYDSWPRTSRRFLPSFAVLTLSWTSSVKSRTLPQ